MKVLVIGGVAAGTKVAAKLKRESRETEVLILTKSEDISYAGCGLPYFEKHEAFPEGVNTEFVRVLDEKTVEMRVWERGSGETLACGTGACAVAAACVMNGYTEEEVTVKLLGGDLKIFWDRKEDTIYMTGPAEVVFDGTIEL